MPRTARQWLDGELHHCIVKGHDGGVIVVDDDDRRALAESLLRSMIRHDVRALDWQFLTTHGHFFSSCSVERLSACMHDALGPYAQRFNKRHGRAGALFVDRFWSRPVLSTEYARNLPPYITLNCWKAGIVPELEDLKSYRWGGFGHLMGEMTSLLPMDVDATLLLYAPTIEAGRHELEGWVAAAAERWREDLQLRSLDSLIRVVSARHGVPDDEVRAGNGHRWFVAARKEIVTTALSRGMASTRQLAAALGVSRHTIWRITQRAA